MLASRGLLPHPHVGDDHDAHSHDHFGQVGATSLSVHSFLDGIGIGLAFQVSTAVGLVVAFAVLAHDFSDGINTVSFILKHGGERKQALKWLLIDAFAPLLGVISASFFTLSDSVLGLLLAIFCGFFLYIGASDLLPESHHRHPTFITSLMTVLGAAGIFIAIRIAGL
jgi:ZIP family zinc transporter